MHNLEKYYSGDDNWKEFVELYEEFWSENDFQDSLLKELNNDLDIAKVVYGKFPSNTLKIINQKVPALDDLKIIDCVSSKQLILRLRECLMRMP